MSNHTILLIDYEPRSIERARRTLTGAGYRVEVATDGPAGLAAFHRISPALVLVEAMLPKKHGFEVCQELKRTPHGQKTPIIITTGVYKGRKYRTQALHTHKCDEYLEKPVSDEQLLGCVAKFIGEPGTVELPISGPARPEDTSNLGESASTLVELDPDVIEIVADDDELSAPIDNPAPSSGTAESEGAGSDSWESEIAARLDALLGADVDAIGLGDLRPPNPDNSEQIRTETESAATESKTTAVALEEQPPVEAKSSTAIVEPSSGVFVEAQPDPQTDTARSESGEPREHVGQVVSIESKRGRKGRKRQSKPALIADSVPLSAVGDLEGSRATDMPASGPLPDIAEDRIPATPTPLLLPPPDEMTAGPMPADVPRPTPSEEVARPASRSVPFRPTPVKPEVRRRTSAWIWLVVIVVALVLGYFLLFRGRDGSAGRTVRTGPPSGSASRGALPLPAPRQIDLPAPPASGETGSGAESTTPALATSAPREPPSTPPARSLEGPESRAPQTPPRPVPKQTTESPATAALSQPLTSKVPDAGSPKVADGNEHRHDDADTIASEPAVSPDRSELEPLGVDPVPTGLSVAAPPAVDLPATEPGKLVPPSQVDSAPVAIKRVLPTYTSRARALRQQGTVELSLLIDETGAVVDVRVVGGIPESDLNDAAVSAARKWLYKPAVRDGVPVKTTKIEKIAFKL